MDEIKPGDTVQLKSGGVPMTIGTIDKYGSDAHQSAECYWFDGNENRKALFPVHTLQKVVVGGIDLTGM